MTAGGSKSGDANDWGLDAEAARQMQQLGVPSEQLEADIHRPAAATPGTVIGVAPHLVEVVDVFAHLLSQWRTVSVGMGGFLYAGLDYQAIKPTLWLMGLKPKNKPELFRQLRVMEMEALSALNER